MGTQHHRSPAPEELLAELPDVQPEPVEDDPDDGLRQVDLRRALLTITELDHSSEVTLVQRVAARTLGELPRFTG
jgi:hypothetical protein